MLVTRFIRACHAATRLGANFNLHFRESVDGPHSDVLAVLKPSVCYHRPHCYESWSLLAPRGARIRRVTGAMYVLKVLS